MKKVLSLILAVTMLFSLATIAFAADEKPITINFVIDGEIASTITVDYGEDYTSKAPKVLPRISDGIKYEFAGWECNDKYYSSIYENLPIIEEDAPIYELTFTATFSEVPYDGEEFVEDIIGDEAMFNIKAVWEGFINFLQQVLFYISSLLAFGTK